MMKIFTLAAALGLVTALGAAEADAAPLGRVQTSPIESAIEHVRDGCGWGYRFSRRLQACVPDRRRGPPPRYVRPIDPAAAAVGAVIGGVAAGIAAGQQPRRGPPRRGHRRH